MRSLIAMGLGNNDDKVDIEVVKTLEYVYFQERPQQINIRDKANGTLIVSIRK